MKKPRPGKTPEQEQPQVLACIFILTCRYLYKQLRKTVSHVRTVERQEKR